MNRIALLSLPLLVSIPAAHAGNIQYHVTCIDCAFGSALIPVKMNGSGVVVANDPDHRHAYIVDGGTITRIPALGGKYVTTVSGINDAGVIAASSAGTWEDHTSRFAYSWNGTGFTNVGDSINIYDDAWFSIAAAINDAGQVVGYAEADYLTWGAFIYDPRNGVMTGIAFPRSDEVYAAAVNSQGTVAGTALVDNYHAWVWKAGALTDLGGQYTESDAFAINDLDQVAGDVGVPVGGGNSTRYAAIWNGGQPTLLYGVGKHTAYSFAYGINNLGQAVGDACSQKCVAFLFDGKKMIDVNKRLDASSKGWSLNHAVDINDAGQILGTGTYGGVKQAFIATPVR